MKRNESFERRLSVCRIVTVPFTFATLLPQQIRCIMDAGIDLTLVSSPGPELDEIGRTMSVRCFSIPMSRKPAPLRDVYSLVMLTRFFRSEQFDIVHSSTPKAGFLTALAGVVAKVPIRIHTYTGQAWITLQGPMRWLVREFDRVIDRLDTHLYADSQSQRDFLVSEGLVDGRKITVLGKGSISGVDLQRFAPSIVSRLRRPVRSRLGIAETSVVIVFAGRVTRDKGIVELLAAFRTLRQQHEDLHLALVGPFEPGEDALPAETLDEITTSAHVHVVGFTSKPEEYLAIADIFCLPSYREGFGSVVIEAGAMNLPTVATRVTGLVDAVEDGETGILVPTRNVSALTQALQDLVKSPDIRCRMGRAARERAITYFDAATVNQAVVDEYLRLAGVK